MTATFPEAIVLISGAMAMDGGSIRLRGRSHARTIEFSLDWSIASQRSGRTQFSVDGEPVPRTSDDETRWLRLLEIADCAVELPRAHAGRLSPQANAIGDDIARYVAAIKRGPDDALRELARRLVELVRSSAYQTPSPHTSSSSEPTEEVRALLEDGKRLEAARAYRRFYPDVTLAEALEAVDVLARRP